MDLLRRNWRIVLVSIAFAFFFVGVYANERRIEENSKREDQRQLDFFQAVCERNNLFKGTVRVAVARSASQYKDRNLARDARRFTDKLLPTLNCVDTFQHNNSRGVPLTQTEDENFIRVVSGGMVPIMSPEGGEVIGGREPEQGELADF